jgi:uroporphyrinogen-III decarboxylase
VFPRVERAPDRRRFVEALLRRPAAEVPFFETEFSPAVAGAILGRPVNVRSYELSPPEYIELLERTGIDVAYLHVPSRFGRVDRLDPDGRRVYVGGAIASRADLAKLKTPSLEPVRRRIESFLAATAASRIGWIYALDTATEVATAMGYENYYASLYEDPGLVEELQIRYEAYALPLTELVLEYRPDAVFLAVNLCGKNGRLLSLEHTERFVLAGLRRQMAPIRRRGVPAILHSDGDNRELMDEWIALGLAGLHPVEPTGGFDIYAAKARWGTRIALLGNIDLGGVLVNGSPEAVVRDTTAHLERLAPGGGYICGSSHDIDDNVPLPNLRAMLTTVLSWKRDAGAGRG